MKKTVKYNSLEKCLQQVESAMQVLQAKETSSMRINDDWYGTTSMAEALDIARNGKQQALDGMNYNKIDVPTSNADSINRKRVYAVAGSSVSVGRALAGQPKAMRKRLRQPTTKKVLNVLIFGAISAFNKPQQVVEFGSKVVNDILDLERRGYRCNVWWHDGSAESIHTYEVFIKLKDSGQPISRNLLTFPLISPAMERRIIFAELEKAAYVDNNNGALEIVRNAYGKPIDIETAEQRKRVANAAGIQYDRAYALQVGYKNEGYVINGNADTWQVL